MKSKRAMIERRNTERRLRRELKKNPPGQLSIWFDILLKWGQRLFLLSFFVVALSPIMLLIPGLNNTHLIAFTAERVYIFLLFGILPIVCLVGIRLILKQTNDSSRNGEQQDLRRKKTLKTVVLVLFAAVFIVSAIVCWAQLKTLVGVWQSVLINNNS